MPQKKDSQNERYYSFNKRNNKEKNEKSDNRERFRNSNFQSLMEVVAGKYNFARQFQAIRICVASREVIKNIFSELSEEIKVLSFSSGKLSIGVSSSSLAQKLNMKADEIINEINNKLKVSFVKSLKLTQTITKSVDNN